MKSKQAQPWLPAEKIQEYVHTEPALLLIGLAVIAGVVYKLFLAKLSPERHESLQGNFRNLGLHLGFGALLFLGYSALELVPAASGGALDRLAPYLGLATLVQGAVIFVKTLRILLFEYMYISHMRVAFPLLVVNLFSLVISIGMAAWIGAEIFGVRLSPLLATAGIFSLVLGLALQDTLGNLFAGIALQFDKPYEIGDWIEVQTGTQKWVGQVYEISWRATVLVGLSDEAVTIPNRVMAQAQVSNFATKKHPIQRNQVFRFPYGVSPERVRETLLQSARGISGVRGYPPPIVLLSESNEHWVAFKLCYHIDDYGSQWGITDRVLSACLRSLAEAGLELASPQLHVRHEAASREAAG